MNDTPKRDVEKKATLMRQAIAENMVNSWSVSPKCDYFMKCDSEKLMDFRKAYEKKNGKKVSILSIVIKAASLALKEYPFVNSSYDGEGKKHLMHQDINVGFVVATGDGLIIPNVKNSDAISLEKTEDEVQRILDDIKAGTMKMNDFTQGSLTINNMGQYERMQYHTAIINQPELAIVSIYRIKEELTVKNGQPAVGKIMNMVISADHRVIDGGMAYAFLNRVCEYLENPGSLME